MKKGNNFWRIWKINSPIQEDFLKMLHNYTIDVYKNILYLLGLLRSQSNWLLLIVALF